MSLQEPVSKFTVPGFLLLLLLGLFCFEASFSYVVLAGLKLTEIVLSLIPKC